MPAAAGDGWGDEGQMCKQKAVMAGAAMVSGVAAMACSTGNS
ncbi:hypothetical protein [Pseudarthrobacter sp. NCCP-2145]|nr:hypothetical protein [Pseudarthrobacter sp. NCCP-2145]